MEEELKQLEEITRDEFFTRQGITMKRKGC